MTKIKKQQPASGKAKGKEQFPVTSFVLPNGSLGEMLYDSTAYKTSFAVYDGKHIKEKKCFSPDENRDFVPYSANNPLLIHKTIGFPEAVGESESEHELISQIQALINKYVELPEAFEEIATHYVLLTWLHDNFNELPYLRVRGDYGTGKTRFLSVVGALCYKPIIASGASSVAPLFHILDQIGGTLILDEADFRFSNETADIIKILNNGNAKGFPVMRCEKVNNREFKPRAYQVFGPKIIATRRDYNDDALESRCITCDMGNESKRVSTPTTLPESFQNEVLVLRNKLLSYRLLNHHRKRSVVDISQEISRRANQIYGPLLSFVRDSKVRACIIKYVQDLHEQARADRGLKTEAELLQTIQKLKENGIVSISALTKQFTYEYGHRYERKITPKWVGGIVRKRLRLATRKTNGIYIISENQQDKLSRLFEKFDLLDTSQNVPDVPKSPNEKA